MVEGVTRESSSGRGPFVTDLARQGSDAARFYGCGVHQTGYGTGIQLVLDRSPTKPAVANERTARPI
jgi:hypothetical protein